MTARLFSLTMVRLPGSWMTLAASAVLDPFRAILAHVLEALGSGQPAAGRPGALPPAATVPGAHRRRRATLRCRKALGGGDALLRSRPLRRPTPAARWHRLVSCGARACPWARQPGRREPSFLISGGRSPGFLPVAVLLLELLVRAGAVFWNCGLAPARDLSSRGGGRRFSPAVAVERPRRWRWRRCLAAAEAPALGGGGGGALVAAGVAWGGLLGRPLLLPLFFFFSSSACACAPWTRPRRSATIGASSGAESEDESSSQAASAIDRHVLNDPSSLRRPRVAQAEPVRNPVSATSDSKQMSHFEAARRRVLRYQTWQGPFGQPYEVSGP